MVPGKVSQDKAEQGIHFIMFKNLQKELGKLAQLEEVSVPIDYDCDGFLDKQCPSEVCLFTFKINGEDWTSIVRV